MISVVVLGYNNYSYTQRCIEHLAQSPCAKEYEVIFMDNGSTDDTPTLANQFSTCYRRYKYIRNEVNLSCSRALNKAVKSSTGSILLFLNNDIMVGQGSVDKLIEALVKNSRIGLAGTKLVYPGREIIQHAGVVPMLWGYPLNYGVGAKASDSRFNQEREIFCVTGAMSAVGRDVFDAVGGFDEEYFWGYEDVDICLKVREAGKQILYFPQAESIHIESLTLGKNKPNSWLERNYLVYQKKWGHILSAMEAAYLRKLRAEGATHIAIFGTGLAAERLYRIFANNGFTVPFFISSSVNTAAEFLGRPVKTINQVGSLAHDRIIVGSQFFFEIESDLPRNAVFPVVDV